MVTNNLAKIIKESPYKRPYIEKYMGISRNTLSNWCRSVSYPSIPQLLKLAALLNVSMDDIYKWEEEK
ncbi:helix-turn-helix transcriptional regulator [Bacillus sp. FJAT-49705]|uniref:Helix-turn-helix transcriptional regulator n=1 Tax=Cytobacillus citreus TaxID=2833586 RepID=A0ABS5NLH8_9BACI|nr:helix-turn-helix transcriptional regulator [Cytobacillus citreus]MBS4188666.1 helix-turn-helix transcriptional regulator [Cytobacillus citreus]